MSAIMHGLSSYVGCGLLAHARWVWLTILYISYRVGVAYHVCFQGILLATMFHLLFCLPQLFGQLHFLYVISQATRLCLCHYSGSGNSKIQHLTFDLYSVSNPSCVVTLD